MEKKDRNEKGKRNKNKNKKKQKKAKETQEKIVRMEEVLNERKGKERFEQLDRFMKDIQWIAY